MDSTSSEPVEVQAAPAPTKPKSPASPDDSGLIRLTARLEPKVHQYLTLLADTEDISLNDAINLAISRYHHYPKDLAEVSHQINHAVGQLGVIESQLELAQLHEADLISLIENGKVEDRMQAIRDQEEQTFEASSPASTGAVRKGPAL